MDEDPYEACSYCNKSIFPGVVRCPYCGQNTDGLGPYGLGETGGPRRLSRVFLVAGVLLALAFALPLLMGLLAWLRGR